MNKRNRSILILLILVEILAFSLLVYFSGNYSEEFLRGKNILPESYVSRVIDGDTFVLADGKKVRLICIDTPEKWEGEYFEAKEFLRILIENKEVRLEKDISETDRYNRLLRYAYVNITNSSGTFEIFVNRELYKQGVAKILRYPPDIKRCGEIES